MAIQKTVMFFNPFRTFTQKWDGEDYTVQQNQRVYMQDWLAAHVAKHLVDRTLNELGLPTNFECSDPTDPRYENSRSRLLKRVILEASADFENSTKQDLAALNQNATEEKQPEKKPDNSLSSSAVVSRPWCDSCDSKGMRHKKICPKNPYKEPVIAKEEFQSLNSPLPEPGGSLNA